MATEPFKLDPKLAMALGLEGMLNQEKLQVISASVASRLVAPCEAALIMLGLPLVEADVKVISVTVRPQRDEVRVVQAGERGGLRASDKYSARPVQAQVGV
jgi:hypothetical protein